MRQMRKVSLFSLVLSVLTFGVAGVASAHVVVTPNEVVTGSRVTFAVSVPNEHDTPVVSVRLVIPEGLSSVRPYAKAGWNVQVTKTGEGEDVTATEISWTGGSIPVSLKDDFLFGAKVPAEATELKWKAYETYADGRVVAWEQDPSDADGNKPYSVTEVVSESATTAAVNEAAEEASQAKRMANRAFYVAIAGVVLGLVGVFMASRDRS